MSSNYWKLGIVGWPLGYSLSPLMHQAALKAFGLEGEYKEYPVKPEDLDRWLKEDAPKLDGFNVTMPHKKAAFEWLLELERVKKGEIHRELDRVIGAINTVEVFKDGYFRGYNTDGDGFYAALCDPSRSIDAERMRVLLLGSGGAAQAIAMVLADVGVGQMMIWNRHPQRAEQLVEKIRASYRGCKAVSVSSLQEVPFGEVDILVNATSVGMLGVDELLVDANRLPPSAIVYDIVYDPPETPLIRAARRRGMRAITGLEMLVAQGAEAFGLWTRKNTKKVLPVMRKALDEYYATGA